MKFYVISGLLALVLIVVIQRGCQGPLERWRERIDDRKENIEERRESWRKWWDERRRTKEEL